MEREFPESFAISLVCACMFLSTTCSLPANAQSSDARDRNDVQSRLRSIASALTHNEVKQLEIVEMSPEILTRSRVTPEMLERDYSTKIIIRDVASRKRLSTVFGSLSAQKRTEKADLRWGLIFYNSDDKRIGSVYFDKFGHYGTLDDSPVSFQGGFFQWLRDTFAGCAQ